MMENKKVLFHIGEVADLVGIKTHVLRHWENEFPLFRPGKTRSGHRIYRREDIRVVERIRDLLYKEGYTIPGAKRRLWRELKGRGAEEDPDFIRSEIEASIRILRDARGDEPN